MSLKYHEFVHPLTISTLIAFLVFKISLEAFHFCNSYPEETYTPKPQQMDRNRLIGISLIGDFQKSDKSGLMNPDRKLSLLTKTLISLVVLLLRLQTLCLSVFIMPSFRYSLVKRCVSSPFLLQPLENAVDKV